MVKVEYILSPDKLSEVKEAMHDMGIHGMTVTEVTGSGNTSISGIKELIQGAKIEMVISDNIFERVVKAIMQIDDTADGSLFISQVSDVIRIRTEETGDSAI